MFTGIVEETGRVHSVQKTPHSIRLVVRAKIGARGVKLGDSVAVNGCCLTVVRHTRGSRGSGLLHFDLLRETWDRTNLRAVKQESGVNLERSLSANGRLGGHFVTGHVDATGIIERWEPSGSDYLLEISASPSIMRGVVFKGSIAIDGISLTIAEVKKRRFRIWIIPHTREVTALSERKVGDEVNLETDILGKYVERILALS